MENLPHLTVHKVVKVDIASKHKNVDYNLRGQQQREDNSIQVIPLQNQCIQEERMLLGVLQLISTTTNSLISIHLLERIRDKQHYASVAQVITMFNLTRSEIPTSTMCHQMRWLTLEELAQDRQISKIVESSHAPVKTTFFSRSGTPSTAEDQS